MTISPALTADPATDSADNAYERHREPAALAAGLVRRADEDRRLTAQAQAVPTRHRRDLLQECHRENAEALKAIVAKYGWPTVDMVGDEASTAALMILLHAQDLGFQLFCRDLIAEAVEDGRCPAVHHAYIADHCAVEQGQPQFYGTRIDPWTMRPYEIRRPENVEERRADAGLCSLEQQMQMLRQRV